MDLEVLITLVTAIVTFVCGIIAKKNEKFSNHLIPIQNIIIGLIVAVVEWILTKDFSTAIMLSGLLAGGSYDVVHNLEKIIRK